CWKELDVRERFIFVKLVGGGFRVGVSKHLVTRALARSSGLDAKVVATRMMGYHDSRYTPAAEDYLRLIAPADQQAMRLGQPFPFFLAHPLQEEPGSLGELDDWMVEWKYDGIRAQVVKQNNQVWIWSRGEDLVSEQFPELQEACASWPDGTVLDGEILVWSGNKPAGFSALQTRLNRKRITPKLRAEAPVIFMAYDCLMLGNQVITQLELRERRAKLEAFVQARTKASTLGGLPRLILSKAVKASSWNELAEQRRQSRALGVEGFMLKQLTSRYGVGRTKADGIWYKWKVDPMTIDCVLVYAQRGHGRRASLYTDYTFAVWDRMPTDESEVQELLKAIANSENMAQTTARGLPCLVPFAKAYSGLTDEEFKQVDREIRKHTVNKFGPVRTVVPSMVFEIGFEAIARSNRHKSGVAVRFPRMLRIRHDKPLAQADSLNSLSELLPTTGQTQQETK
ncbi:MAG: ATP-dependent DNA ligase, partial [Limnobacter sp.]|nr:ATP-dependent DNA ligase [Limnobacter sp.]